MAFLAAIMARKEGRLGRRAIGPRPPEFPGNADNQSPIEGALCQTLIADNACSILPILAALEEARKWGQKYGILSLDCRPNRGSFGQRGIYQDFATICWQRGPSVVIRRNSLEIPNLG